MSRSKQIDMSGVRLARVLQIGCIRLVNANTLPLAQAFIDISATEVSITFRGDTPKPWDDVSLASIRMFKLPRGNTEFQRLIEWFSDKRKTRARLPDGLPFDESTLAIRRLPEGWKHEGFARSGRDFIHIYQTKKLAILVRLMGQTGTVLDNPLLKRIHRNLCIVDGQWVTDFPATEHRKQSQQKIKEAALSPNVIAEIHDASARGRDLLKLGRTARPPKTADAIYRFIEEVRGWTRVSANEKKQLAIDLGALWGDALCTARKWNWCCLSPTSNQQIYAVCSPNRSHAVDPIALVHTILTSKKVVNNSLLLFNMISSGKLPEAPENAFCWLS